MTRLSLPLIRLNIGGWTVSLVLMAIALNAQGPLQLTLNFSAPSCAGSSDGTATATVSGGLPPYTYQWSNGGQTATIADLSAGTYTVTVSDNAGNTRVGSVNLVQPSPIRFNVIVNVPSCNGFPATVTVLPFGGTPPYFIQWSNGTQGPTSSGLLPTKTYLITVTDAKGCQRDTAICPPTTDSLRVQLMIKKAECPGINNGSATAMVTPSSGNYRYSWNISPLNVPQITGLSPGTLVAVTVTDQTTGCSGKATGVIGANTQMQVKITGTQKLNCSNDRNGALTAQVFGGSAPYTYIWRGPGVNDAATPSIAGLGPGTYTVTVSDARGCTSTGSYTIGILSDLRADFTLFKFCSDTAFWVKFLSTSTSTPVIILWEWRIVWNGRSAQSNQPSVTVPIPNRTSGLATLIVTNSEGCTDTITKPFTVDSLLDFRVVTPGYSCDNSAVPIAVLGDSTFSYTWSPTDFLTFNPGPQQVLANPPTTTKYRLVVSNGACTSTDTVLILRQPPLELTATGDETCGGPGVLKATTNRPAAIVWTTLAGDTINPLSALPGIYRAIATDSFKCVRTATAAVVSRKPQVAAVVPPNACPSEPFSLVAQNLNPADNLTYLWTATPPVLLITNPTAPATTAAGPKGNYALRLLISNNLGCLDTLNFSLTLQDSVNIQPFVSARQACDSYRAFFTNTSGLPGVWNFGNGNTATSNGADTLTALYIAPGSYDAVFTPSAGCAKPANLKLQISNNIFTVNAPDVTACKPAAALIATTNQPGTIVWTTLTGQPVADPNAVPAGVYIARATDLSGLCTAVDTAVVTLQDSIDLTGKVS
ncbi:MAG: SprB repeat-containing protein, partial [Saprospiraceae bacterium]|nr:SprB repeat-containing protein [Saprospiraceae bacterium]MDW8485324.1 SprB repeat-containing protein [Saprospiraceae bacterium]